MPEHKSRSAPPILPTLEEAPIRARVLVAEDDAEMRAMLTTVLRREGYLVHEAADGTALDRFIRGVARGEELDPDLIITDIRMPGLSGLEVLQGLRQGDWATPVVMITAFGDEATHAEAHRLGATAVLDKPFELDEFLDLVEASVPPRM
jgi:two-component system, response regulator, stage 0 sporulation protein F